jgi:hypothetical protein
MDGPWSDTNEGVMWSYPPGHGRFPLKRGIRNDALWAAKEDERRTFVELAHRWREAAIADGWQAEPTYGDHEPLEQAWKLRRDGYTIQGLSRPGSDKMLPSAAVHIWGPDGLAIKPPVEYDSAAILRGSETCSECGAHPVKTERVAFANRVCADCAPDARRKYETPGWCK